MLAHPRKGAARLFAGAHHVVEIGLKAEQVRLDAFQRGCGSAALLQRAFDIEVAAREERDRQDLEQDGGEGARFRHRDLLI